ncbi:hypothetical protein [Ancylobacter rudongensis]|uniref:Uncharacterized protein n=1 Tax=Ancylobacter rudongensis TaxID=177413 RepID=A0A1G4RHP2_9HYPH|nr:hypothetical protein [Ancylobacter rudongensis]SCW56384.1 hypothetical protein SAMN05660859_1661 [Ancylobacter rudongensis]
MNPPEQPLTLTREQAATRQIEAAIAALEYGGFDVAITLAGAAEGMFDFRKEDTIFDGLVASERALARFSRKEWIALLNWELTWLKHSSDRTEPVTIELDAAAFMIARAASKLTKWTPPIEEFRVWFVKRVNGT